MNRRDALQTLGVVGLSKALFPTWMPRLAFRPRRQHPRGDVLVVIFQRGGMDGLNTVVPFGEGRYYYDRRPTIAIREPDGSDESAVDLNGFFGLHPALRPLKDIFDEGQLAVVHAAGSPDSSRSHFDAMEMMEAGTPGDKTTLTGWLNRYLQTTAWQNDSPFRAVGLGAIVPTSLRGSVTALALQSIADFHLQGREDQLALMQRTLARLYEINTSADPLSAQAADVFSTMSLLTQLSATEYTPANGADYPYNEFGMGLQQIAQLIKADVGLEVATVDIGGWDTHENEGGAYGQMAESLSVFAQGMLAFYTDMREYMGRVTVVSMSEFGRTTGENASGGTDHGHGNTMFVMGGNVNGGVVAVWPGLHPDALDPDGDLVITTDYRDVVGEILATRLGSTALDAVFPGYAPQAKGIMR